MIIEHFLPFFKPLDPDPDSESGSGFRIRIWIQKTPESGFGSETLGEPRETSLLM